MNLLDAKLYDPGTAVNKATSSLLAMTALDTTNLRLTVTVPAHGFLFCRMRCAGTGATTMAQVLLGVLEGSTVRARVTPQPTLGGTLATSRCTYIAEFTIPGLTPGSITLDAAYGVEVVVASTNISYGGPNNTTTNDAWGAFVFELWDPRPLAVGSLLTGTAQAGTANTITLATAASTTDGLYDPALLRINSGTGAGQTRTMLQYTGSTRVAVVDRDWRVTPDNTSVYEIIAGANLMSTNEGLAAGGTGSSITLNALASASNNIYNGQLIVVRNGTGQDQSRIISAYNGTTKVATVTQAWTTNPSATSGYMILPVGRAQLAACEAGVIDANAIADGAIDAATFAAGAITAASIAADAITDAKVASDVTIASVTGSVGSVTGSVGSVTGAVGSVAGSVGSVTGAVGSVTGAVGSVTGNVGGNVTGSVGSIATGGIAATSFAAGAINAAAIATNAIDADALAADAVTEIQAGLATAAALTTVASYIDTEIADIQARLPAALVSGRMDASVGAMAAGVVTAAAIATNAIDADALAADAVTEIQAGLATSSALATVQSDTDNIQTRLPSALVGGKMDSTATIAGTVDANVVSMAITGGATIAGGLAITGATNGAAVELAGGTSSGEGILCYAQAGNSPGAFISGFGYGAGLSLSAQGTGPGCAVGSGTGAAALSITGDTYGIRATAAAGHGIFAESLSGGNGIVANGSGSGSGIHSVGGDTGHGMHLQGGATSGHAVNAEAVGDNSHGINVLGGFAGNGINVYAPTGVGIRAVSDEAAGMLLAGVPGLQSFGNGSGAGAEFSGGVGSPGILAQGGDTGHGMHLLGGASSGDGLHAEGAAGLDISGPNNDLGTGGTVDVNAIADAVWDEPVGDHVAAGSTGEALTDAGAGGNPWNSIAEGALTFGDIVRIQAGVAAGKTTIASTGPNAADVTFRSVTDTSDIVVAQMESSERVAVTLNP